MPKYLVSAIISESQEHLIEVDAENPDEARQLVDSGEFLWENADSTSNEYESKVERIDSVDLIEDEEDA